jgi:predicted methyltransferase
MRSTVLVLVGLFSLLACGGEPDRAATAQPGETAGEPAVEAAAPAPDNSGQDALAQAVADAGRPAEDVARDAARKPAEVLAFAGVKPGDTVVDLIPGGGYFTRILSKAVGPEGRVYALTPPPSSPDAQPAPDAIAADPAYANVTVVALSRPPTVPEPVDLIWTAQNYHDLHLSRLQVDVPDFNKAMFDALKPGGAYVVLDHAALPGSEVGVADTLHRIDPEIVKREVVAAGFVFEGESSVLRNPADPRNVNVFDASIRGSTDQFIYKFRKPR